MRQYCRWYVDMKHFISRRKNKPKKHPGPEHFQKDLKLGSIYMFETFRPIWKIKTQALIHLRKLRTRTSLCTILFLWTISFIRWCFLFVKCILFYLRNCHPKVNIGIPRVNKRDLHLVRTQWLKHVIIVFVSVVWRFYAYTNHHHTITCLVYLLFVSVCSKNTCI